MNPSSNFAAIERQYFEELSGHMLKDRRPGEHLFLALQGEESQFVRLSRARVRQIGTVMDATLSVTLVVEHPQGVLRRATHALPLTGISYVDREETSRALAKLRAEVPTLPIDPYAVLPQDTGSSQSETQGALLPVDSAVEALVSPLGSLDFAGIYASGRSVRALANSAGQRHWFATDTFTFDYSLYTQSERAAKGLYAGTRFDRSRFDQSVQENARKLTLLERPARRLAPGEYRAYLEPAATADLIAMLNWGAISEAAIRQGDSPLRKVRSGEAGFSPLFSLTEDFSTGRVPRFNDEGELAPERLPLIREGALVSTLVSSRSAREYGMPANGAVAQEMFRSPVVAAGALDPKDALKRLGSGLYLSNLHYLNWSDQPGGRITGMTRYACFWIENGEIVAPIENLRFDDTIFHLLGDALEDFSSHPELHAETGTYGMRHLGGSECPGMLVSRMKFTL